jgi:hypothetical protein
MTKERKPTKESGMVVLMYEAEKIRGKNLQAAEILNEAAVDLAKKVGKRKDASEN